MAERETFQQQVRDQMQAGEHMLQDAFRTWTALTLSAAETTFRVAEHNVRSSQELLTIYRRVYQDGVKTWQDYWQNIGESINRAAHAATEGTPRS